MPAKKPKMPGGLQAFAAEMEEAQKRPSERVTSMTQIGRFIGDIRRGLKIRQMDLAARAQVGRHWIVEMEQGKQSLEVGLVLRTLETLGFEITLTPYAPIPTWIKNARVERERREREVALRRRRRRQTRRDIQREGRLRTNRQTVWPDLE